MHGFGGSADHWRRNLPPLSSLYDTYAVDLLGYGYSCKPAPRSTRESPLNGEPRRAEELANLPLKYNGPAYEDQPPPFGPVGSTQFTRMRHPTGSAYNFYAWSDQLADFAESVMLPGSGHGKVFLACNSVGCSAGWGARRR